MRNGSEEPTMTGYDLIPPWEQTKLVCMTCAGGDVTVFRRLYYEDDYGDVWEALGLQKAYNWTPPPKKEQG